MPTQTNYQRPIHECVIPDDVDKQGDPTWTNRYKNARVTPPKPDSAQTSPSCTPSSDARQIELAEGYIHDGKGPTLPLCTEHHSIRLSLQEVTRNSISVHEFMQRASFPQTHYTRKYRGS